MKSSRICALVAVLFLRESPAWASEVPSPLEVKEQLPVAARQYVERLREFQCDTQMRDIDRVNGKEIRYRTEWRQRDDCGLILNQPADSASGPIELVVYGEKYGFRCTKRDESSGWVLARLVHPLSETTAQTYGSGANVRIALSPYYIGRRFLPDWIGLAGFTIDRVEAIDRNGRNHIRAEFRWDPRSEDGPKASGYFIADPSRYWIISESKLIETWPQSTLTSVARREFREIDSLPVSVHAAVDKTSTLKGMEAGALIVTDVAFERKQVPLEQFRLSAFGLPEPQGVKWDKPTKRYWWLIGGGAGLVAVSALLYFARHRTRQPTAA